MSNFGAPKDLHLYLGRYTKPVRPTCRTPADRVINKVLPQLVPGDEHAQAKREYAENRSTLAMMRPRDTVRIHDRQ